MCSRKGPYLYKIIESITISVTDKKLLNRFLTFTVCHYIFLIAGIVIPLPLALSLILHSIMLVLNGEDTEIRSGATTDVYHVTMWSFSASFIG